MIIAWLLLGCGAGPAGGGRVPPVDTTADADPSAPITMSATPTVADTGTLDAEDSEDTGPTDASTLTATTADSGHSGRSGGTADTGAAAELVVGQGHLGRMVRSAGTDGFDHDMSTDDTLVCWGSVDNEPDCDHRDDTARGLGFGQGWFVSTWGWGAPGEITRSQDGITWETVHSGTTAAGIAYGEGAAYPDGVFLAGDWAPLRSTDDGATWTPLSWAVDANPRGITHVDAGGGRFLLFNDGPLRVSADAGDSWTIPPAPAGCGVGPEFLFAGGAAYGDGTLLVVSGDGTACRSTDDGASFTPAEAVGAWLSARVRWVGDRFEVFSPGQRHTSTDGLQWSTEATVPAVTLDAVTALADGTRVGIGGWYADQQAWSSTDGVHWSPVAFTGGHPVTALVAGRPD